MLLKTLIRVIRAPFFTAVIVPTLLGTAIAWHKGYFHWVYFLLALFGVISTNAATNTANDYFDYLSGNDEYNRDLTPFSGGSRVIQEKILSPWQMLAVSGVFYVIAIAIGLYLSYVRGWTLLYLGVTGVLISLLYNPWIAYFGYGLGELVTGLACGPITVCGAYFVQAQRITPEAIWASLPIGFLIALILYINEFPDYEADKAAGKHTIVVQLGRQRAVPGYITIIAAAYVSILAGVLIELLPYTALLAFLTLPLAYQGVQGVRRFYAHTPQLIPTNAVTIQVHLVMGLLLSLAYVIDKALWF